MKPFTQDELEVILAWAAAYVRDEDTTIGSDRLLPREVERLKTKLTTASDHYRLGMLNASFLLGFHNADQVYPLKALVDSCSLSTNARPTVEMRKARADLTEFLQQAGLIP